MVLPLTLSSVGGNIAIASAVGSIAARSSKLCGMMRGVKRQKNATARRVVIDKLTISYENISVEMSKLNIKLN